MSQTAKGAALWQVALLPFLLLTWFLVPVLLIVLLPVQIVAALHSGRGFFRTSPYRFLLLLITQGVDSKHDTFDRRFVVFHPEMSFSRFREIYCQGRDFAVTRGRLRIARPDETLVRSLGHLDPGVAYDPQRIDDFIAVPSSLLTEEGDHFALIITNQGGLGVGVESGHYLIFRRQDTVSGAAPWTVIEPGTVTLRQLVSPLPDPRPPIFGQLVASVPRTRESA